MRLNGQGRIVIAAGMLVAALAPAALAAGGNGDGGETGQPKNGLSSKAFRHNSLTTNAEALRKLVAYPLNDELFLRDGAYIGRQLRDPRAMAVMEELVECALDPDTQVTARTPSGAEIGTWRGELGLCQAWNTRGLEGNTQCQEIVTACLMARVNAVGKAVPLSMRGEPAPLARPRDQVVTVTHFRESPRGQDPSEGWSVPGFSRKCQGPDCDWTPAHVGTCMPGDEIQLAIDDDSQPSVCESTTLRVCAGIHGCASPLVGALPDGNPLPAYSKLLGDKTGACKRSPATFTCPKGPAVAGYYSVMIRPDQSAPREKGHRKAARRKAARQAALDAVVVVKVKGSGKYPAPEQDVFTFPEGAFYGNLFKSELLTRSCVLDEATATTPATISCTLADHSTCKIDPASGDPIGGCPETFKSLPYKDVYACYTWALLSADDETGAAALNERLCGLPDANASCFAYRPQPCHFKDSTANQIKGSHCDALGKDGIFTRCKSQTNDITKFEWVITTYLNDACDFIDNGDLCDTMRKTTASGTIGGGGGGGKVSPGPRGCGGCSLGGGGGGLESASLAAVLAVLLRRRRGRRQAAR